MTTSASRRRFWRPYLLGLATAAAGALLWRGLSAPAPAYGQIPDSGAQRQQMIAELRAANQKLSRIVKLLTEVRDRQPAGQSVPAARPARRPRP